MTKGSYRSETQHNPLAGELGMRQRVPRLSNCRRSDQSRHGYGHH